MSAALDPTPAQPVSSAATPAESWRALYPFTSHFIEVDGHRLHYLDEGPRDAPVWLCLHGNPTWSFYWRSMILAFRDRYRMIALDHLGCGLSDKPQDWPYRLDGHIRNVQAFATALDLRGITLAVHDWGGAIGCGFAVREPDRVARLVITNTAAFPSPRIPLRIAVCRIPGFGALAVRGLNGFARAAIIECLHRLKGMGIRSAYIAGYSEAAVALYGSLGAVNEQRAFIYERGIGPAADG